MLSLSLGFSFSFSRCTTFIDLEVNAFYVNVQKFTTVMRHLKLIVQLESLIFGKIHNSRLNDLCFRGTPLKIF